MEIADRMRLQNQEQFHTLVRMHLSFELDLNTDDNEVIVNEKIKFRKRFHFHKKPKGAASSKSGSPACPNTRTLTSDGIAQLRQLKEFLMQDQNVIQEGIFRRTGSVARQNELKSRIVEGGSLCLDSGTYSVHDVASVLKGILADLPEPLLTDTYCPAHLQMADLCNNMDPAETTKATRLLHSLQLLILLLPAQNRVLLKDIIEMLNQTMQFEPRNKMSADSLATLFTPHLICPKKLTPEALHQTSQNMSAIISFMITKGSVIFEIPPKLATDIRAYFVEQKRKETMSPEHILDESVTSDSTANTVYTFVDRERTAQAQVQDPTDTCLAQLYAYIQSLPESSKKRKLIKQFNKENGQGTPLQLQLMQRLKNTPTTTKRNSKSLGDSIKRHIFHKNLIMKTPKHQPVSTPSSAMPTFNTPSRSQPLSTLPTKTRLLFQSPVTGGSMKAPSTVTSTITKSTSSRSSNSTPPSVTHPAATNTPLSPSSSDQSNLDHSEYERLSETISKLQQNATIATPVRKTVGFTEISNAGRSESPRKSELKSRYKSEPNLSRILTEHDQNQSNDIDRFIGKKLLKGVSMVNLGGAQLNAEFSELYHTPVKESRRHDGDENVIDEDIDDLDFEATPNSHASYDEYRTSEFLLNTNTPTNQFLGRRSMSPITKSTQRMSKAMQESIMTPRSRKPVMLTGALLGSDQSAMQQSFSTLREEDEDEANAASLDTALSSKNITTMYRSKSEGDFTELLDDKNYCLTSKVLSEGSRLCLIGTNITETLTSPFRNYLFSRSVISTSPVDSSFSSHPDDFGSAQDIQNLTESELSESLLFCLNGNQPPDGVEVSPPAIDSLSAAGSRVSYVQSVGSGCRKRGNSDLTDQRYFEDMHPKKMVVVVGLPPGETSL